jgi:ATP-dependent Clp endopeptidase proteolytic subunit ClpP
MTVNTEELRSLMRTRMPEVIDGLRATVRANAADLGPVREAGYKITAADDTSVIKIYDEIWWLGINAQDLTDDLARVTSPNIRVEINSPGGDVFDGIAIYNALRTHPAHVTTRVDGIAASIASVISQAGDTRIMLDSSQMMIHNAWGMTVGNADEHDDMRQLLAQQDSIIAGIYASRSGGDAGVFRQMMSDETWMTAEQAVEHGLADVVSDPSDNKTSASARTLNDELRDTVTAVSSVLDSAARVAALRADAGKDLSAVNCESLVGLRAQLTRVDEMLAVTDDVDSFDVANEFARFVALTKEYTA